MAAAPVLDLADRLVARVAAGDRSALRTLYALLAIRVWQLASGALPAPDAAAVTHQTFLEVWHGARAHARADSRAWVLAVAAVRADDRLRCRGVDNVLGPVLDDLAHRRLSALLGSATATVRTGPATFTRVTELARAVDMFAQAAGERR